MKPERDEAPLGAALRDVASEEDLATAWDAIERARVPARRPRLRTGGIALAALAAAAALALFAARPTGAPPGPLAVAGGAPLRAIAPASHVALGDGSGIETGDDAALEVLENQAGLLALHLTRGRARFRVTPGTGRRWRVEASGLSVEVVGTVFVVERTPDEVRVAVERGAVVVRGDGVPDGVRRLAAGESIAVPRARATTTPDTTAPEAPPAIARAAEATGTPETTRETEEAALAPLRGEPRGRADPPAPSRSPPDLAAGAEPAWQSPASLMIAADAARARGDASEAIATFDRIAREHPSSAEAPLAAFTAARLLARRGRAEAARARYRRALELGLPPELAEDARRALEEPDAP